VATPLLTTGEAVNRWRLRWGCIKPVFFCLLNDMVI
jgi:hypothetical protein